ncbi:hypothetical protein SAICODRAFT_68555 [Saitoella complicata NRRL Y-17804]|uniref:XRRM domain-containing protein n=1 Tax=Saitoella complicata (strain BCRC 22490 / CBS 7301 / JCM 7358 / NBRC 10748 / NRRL Y-17804) TaxID=698492 RepID=A0A0E9NDC4_SAICN|nr:uncharacterized protein SAICODRAFT_68555 [Saitoella complicata NRRL Y-17804]ODQ56177.1 hypothetical protein SAICODRAFT_68555 [Saitoella complicata NRRL Y-17804]GAO47857.1 hypothetical protein G7K_2053-t1 [Saitoella complicata NRRL Y-17804]
MFVPRTVKRKLPHAVPAELPPRALQPISTGSVAAQPESSNPADTSSKHPPRAPTGPVQQPKKGPNYSEEDLAWKHIVALEMLFAPSSSVRFAAKSIDGSSGWIHLSHIISHRSISNLRPSPSQIALATALRTIPSALIELSADGYHVRQRELPFNPLIGTDDEMTIYVEPVPAKLTDDALDVAVALRKEMSAEDPCLPIQRVFGLGRGYALVLLSSIVDESTVKNIKMPMTWMVLTKAEHDRRDVEYQRLIQSDYDALRRRRRVSPEPRRREEGRLTPPREVGRLTPPPLPSLPPKSRPASTSTPTPYEKGLILHLSHLHEETNKPTIQSFLAQVANRQQYFDKNPSAQLEYDGAPIEDATDTNLVHVQYVDYTKPSDTAYVRLSTPAEAILLARALTFQHRVMRAKDDCKGTSVGENSERKYVVGNVLEGERERIYWEMLEDAKTKGKRKRKAGDQDRSRAVESVGEVQQLVVNKAKGTHMKFD